MSKEKKTFFVNTVHTLVTKVFIAGLKLALSVLTARTLGVSGRGLFFLSTSLAGTTSTVGSISIGEGLTFLIAKGNLPPGDNLITNTEKFDGTTFATSASVTTGAQYACGTGATIGGVIHGGGTPLAGTNSTEEFTDGTETITASTLTTS